MKKYRKEGSRHGRMKVTLGKMTKSDAMEPRFPDAFIQLKFVMTSDWGILSILMYFACIGQILVEKRNNS